MMRQRLAIGILVGVFILASCSRHPAVNQGIPGAEPGQVPDSLRVKLTVQIPLPDSTEDEVDGVLWAKPGKSYRLELSGPLGIQVASLLWTKEGWVGLLPSQERYVQGKGEIVMIPGVLLPPVSIHKLLSFAWGKQELSDGSLRYEYASDHVRILNGDRWLMTLWIKEQRADLKWGGGIWKLPIPEGWRSL